MTGGGRNHRNRFVTGRGERPWPPRGRRPELLLTSTFRRAVAAPGWRSVQPPVPPVHVGRRLGKRVANVSGRVTTQSAVTRPSCVLLSGDAGREAGAPPGRRTTSRTGRPSAIAGGAGRPDVRNAAPDVSTTTSRRAMGEMTSLTAAMPRNGGSVGSAASASSSAPSSSAGVDALAPPPPPRRPAAAAHRRAGARAEAGAGCTGREPAHVRTHGRGRPPRPRDGGDAPCRRRRQAHLGDRLLGLLASCGVSGSSPSPSAAWPGPVRNDSHDESTCCESVRGAHVASINGSAGAIVLDHRQRVGTRCRGLGVRHAPPSASTVIVETPAAISSGVGSTNSPAAARSPRAAARAPWRWRSR